MEHPDVAVTRAAYDTVAEAYAELLAGSVEASPFERGALAALAEVLGAAGAPVADVGCGPGRLIGALRTIGLDVIGLDLSPAMVAIARRVHPTVPAAVGSIDRLPIADGRLAAVVAWYSLIHTPTERLPAVFAELRRTLRPGGIVLTGFQVGDEVRGGRRHLYGHDVVLDSYRRPPAVVAAAATSAGLVELTRWVAEPEPPYDCPQAYLILRH